MDIDLNIFRLFIGHFFRAMARRRALFNVLLSALDELVQDDFQWFKALLEEDTLLEDFGVIRSSRQQTEDKTKVLKAMMEQYGIFTITVIKIVLLELNHNRVLLELSEDPYDPDTKCSTTLTLSVLRP